MARRRARLFGASVIVVLAAGLGACSAPPGGGGGGGGTGGGALYRDPDTQAAHWVASHPTDSRAPTIRDRIANQPQARWFTQANPATIAAEVRSYVAPAAEAGRVPVLVAYAIPGRDCGGASNGGAAALSTWQAWIAALADGLGGARAIVVLEPDALALEDCLDAAQVSARHAALATAVRTIRQADPRAEVYLDAGHSDWHPPAEQARRLREAGVLGASGFATNVSNYNTTEDEIAYGRALLDALGNSGLRQVIDVSRNGNGPAPGAAWCDPPGRALGRAPTLSTGVASVAAYLWIKLPGEADGCAAGAGQFVPDLAYALATG